MKMAQPLFVSPLDQACTLAARPVKTCDPVVLGSSNTPATVEFVETIAIPDDISDDDLTDDRMIHCNVSFMADGAELEGSPQMVWIGVRFPSFLLLDPEAIDKDEPAIEALADLLDVDPGDLINEDIADKGVRDVLPIPVGTVLTLRTGEVGDEGWLALKTIPASWEAAGPADGLRNYVDAESGLGSGNDPEALLDKIPDVTPLRTAG